MNDVKLTMFFGKHYLLIGDNGTGKSTLARQIFLDFKRQGYKAFFIDQFAPISKGTVRDNINWSGADEKDIKHLMGIFELDKNLRDHIERNGVNLSGGEKQKILLIRNLLAKPDILILDESLRMIDKKSKKHILEYITSLNDVTILYISHKLNKDEINLFDGIYLIQNQKLTYIDKESERWSLWDF
jgi:ABC-type bacteriocin/lantibiotic exporter with double-glycine peptidase domain